MVPLSIWILSKCDRGGLTDRPRPTARCSLGGRAELRALRFKRSKKNEGDLPQRSGSQLHHSFPFFASSTKRHASLCSAGLLPPSFLRSDSGGVESDKFSSNSLFLSLAVWSSFLLPLACGRPPAPSSAVGRREGRKEARFRGTFSRGNFQSKFKRRRERAQ